MSRPTIQELESILNNSGPQTIEILPNGEIRALPAVLEFGGGTFIVDTGTFEGKPAVFIANAAHPGPVGTASEREGHVLDKLQAGERVLTFPTEAQAKAVADALCNVSPPRPARAAEDEVTLLPEDAEHRADFDRSTKQLFDGNPLLNVAQALEMTSKTNPSQGSFSKMMAIYANEVSKAAAISAMRSVGKTRPPHFLARAFPHFTSDELYEAQRLYNASEGRELNETMFFSMANINKKMTYLQMARNCLRKAASPPADTSTQTERK